MNKLKLIAGIFLMLTCFTFTSCENEPIDSAINLDDFGGGGNNNNTGVYTATIGADSFSAQTIVAQYTDTAFGPQLNLAGTMSNGRLMNIQIINPAVGSRAASMDPSTLLFFQYAASLNDMYSSLNSTTSQSSGTITITDFNLTTKKVSGTFSFTGYGTLNSATQKEITNGVFTNITFTDTTTPVTTGVVGTYKLTAFNTNPATDLNGDGTSSINQMSEVTCLNNSLLVINANNTYLANSKGVDIDLSGGYTCFTDPDDLGTWALSGNQLTFTSSDITIDPTTFVVSGNTLTYSIPAGTVLTEEGGVVVEVTADITLIYTKQ